MPTADELESAARAVVAAWERLLAADELSDEWNDAWEDCKNAVAEMREVLRGNRG